MKKFGNGCMKNLETLVLLILFTISRFRSGRVICLSEKGNIIDLVKHDFVIEYFT